MQILETFTAFKYLRHIINDRLKDDSDTERERSALAIRSNTLIRTFAHSTRDVKILFFNIHTLSVVLH